MSKKSEILKIINNFNNRIKTFNKFKEGRYSMITTRTCNWDMYIKELRKEISDAFGRISE